MLCYVNYQLSIEKEKLQFLIKINFSFLFAKGFSLLRGSYIREGLALSVMISRWFLPFFRMLAEAERLEKLEHSRREKEARQLQQQEAKRRRQEEVQRQKQEEQMRKIQEREQKRQQTAMIKEQVKTFIRTDNLLCKKNFYIRCLPKKEYSLLHSNVVTEH